MYTADACGADFCRLVRTAKCEPPQVLEVCTQGPPVGDARVWPEFWVTYKIHSWVRWLGIKSVRLRNTKLLQNAKATEPAADALVADE